MKRPSMLRKSIFPWLVAQDAALISVTASVDWHFSAVDIAFSTTSVCSVTSFGLPVLGRIGRATSSLAGGPRCCPHLSDSICGLAFQRC